MMLQQHFCIGSVAAARPGAHSLRLKAKVLEDPQDEAGHRGGVKPRAP